MSGRLSPAWEALARDIHAGGYSVRDAIVAHRAAIEAEALPSVERLARALFSVNVLPFAEEGSDELREVAAAILAIL